MPGTTNDFQKAVLFLRWLAICVAVVAFWLLLGYASIYGHPRWPYKIPAAVIGRPVADVEARFGEPVGYKVGFGPEWDDVYFVTNDDTNLHYYLCIETVEAKVTKAEIVTVQP